MSQDTRKNIDKKTKGKTPSMVPFSNEYVKKVLLGTAIIAGGVGLAGSPNPVYAASPDQVPAIVETVKKEAVVAPQSQEGQVQGSETTQEAPAKDGEDLGAPKEEALADPAQKTAVLPENQVQDPTASPMATSPAAGDQASLEVSPGTPVEAQGAGEAGEQKEEDKHIQKATDPNYGDDEAKIKDYDGSNRYKETDLQPGDTNQSLDKNDEKVEKDGFKFQTKNPSDESPSKTEYGYEITIDKKTGQRTYTNITVTDNGRVRVGTGDKPMMQEGDRLIPDSPKITYKPSEDTSITASGPQRPLNYVAEEDTLKHINNKDNDSTSFGFKDNYTQDNPGIKYFGDSFGITYKVNPWPNENDRLEELKLNKNGYDPKSKYYVQGQDIDTKVKVDNIDDNAKKRLVGQVYNPVTGKVVPGASAYIGDDGNIHIKMPDGAINKDGTINKDSIFYKDSNYKGIQNLDVKFFARPRTLEEFKTIAETPDEFGETGTYVGTGAGSGTINHKGTDVTIDKQGIDRYDHYNLIGDFKLNLDDTRYYDQNFLDGNNEDTSKNTSSAVKPGEPFEVKIYEPGDSLSNHIKSADDMNRAKKDGQASGEVILDFIKKENEGKADKDQWKVTLTDGDISRFTITPPKSAKAGDFVAIPVEYTYTNGSKDTYWFHFVVQESDNYRPEYHAEIGYKGDTLTNTPDAIPEDTQKNKPESYELVPGTYKDSAGNVWDNIKVDPTTGVVTAVVPESANIKGGENLYVDVKVNYTDQKTGQKKEETIKAQFIARPKYKEEVTKEFTSQIPFETKVIYDDTLEAGKVEKTDGVVGEMKTTFKQVVINGEKGIINDKGEFVKDQELVEATTIKEKQDAIIRIGTKPATIEVKIPRETEYVLDYTKKQGEEPTVLEEGNDGLVTVTTKRDPNTGVITMEKSVTTEAKNKKISIPAMTEGTVVDEDKIPFEYDIQFDPDFYKNYPDATDNYKVVTEGVVGTNKKTWTIVNSQIVGDYKLEKTEPTNAVIKVGQKDYTGTVKNTVTKEVPYTVKVVYNPNLDAGKTNVTEGKAGSRTYEYSGEIVNGQLKDGTNFTETELTEKYVAPTDHIIEIGTKPVENEKSVESTVGVDVEWVFDPDKDIGVIEVGDLIPGKVTTKTVNKYNPKTGEIETTQETVVEKGKRKVVAGTKAYNGEFEEVNKDVIPYETEIVFDNNLKAGEKVITQAGENGLKTTTTKHKIVNGEVVSSGDPVTVVNKEAVKQIIKVGSKTEGDHSYTEALPFETKVEVNPDLKKGEWRYKTVDGKEQRGQLGSKTTEWKIVNSEVQGEPRVTEEKPVDAIIEVGSADFTGEVKHKETFEIPFEVEIRYNDQLPAGKSNEIQKGVKGSYDVEYRQDIKNGEVVGEMTKTESNKVEAKKHIIEVGTKVETPENNYSKDVEVEIKYVYDDTKDKGVVETGTLTPGKVETRVVDKYNPETGKVEQTTEEVVTKAVQEVIVGTKDFTGTYEYKKTCPIPFEVEVREDPTLSKGEKKVDQEGKPGSKTTSYEQDIKNGKPEGEARKTGEETTKEPVKHIVLVGTKPLEGTNEKVVDKAISYETKVIYDENLEAGTRVVDNEGEDGTERVTTTITSKDGDITVDSAGEVIKEKQDRVVRVGIRPVVKEEAIPNNTEYKHNPELKAGETKKITDGTPGKVTVTTTFNKETGKLETSVVRTEPTNAEYEYGSKTEGKVTVTTDIPYEVEFVPDDTMAAGETKVTQEGKLGKKETTITIENSKEVGERKEETTEEPVKKIVKYGTLCKFPTPNPKLDDNKPGGNDSGTPGKPSNPDQPGSPDKPGTQDKPNQPSNPDQPGTPDKPSSPNQPGESPENSRPSQEAQDQGQKSATSPVEEGSQKVGHEQRFSNRDDSRAPQTFDPGIASYLGLGGLSSAILAFLAGKKRKEEDQ